MKSTSVALINMPYAAAGMPPLGISLLKAALQRDGVDCENIFFNLEFAAELGVDAYHDVALGIPDEALAAEWTFRDELFPADEQSARYLQDVGLVRFAEHFPLATILHLQKAKGAAGAFLDRCLAARDWSQYAVIGFTSTFQQNVASLALARRIKQRFPASIIVFGGANCEGEMGEELLARFEFVDLVCSGEADISFPELVSRVMRGERTSNIPGVLARGEAASPAQLTSMDALPLPDFAEYFATLERTGLSELLKPVIPVETSRGCWWGEKHHCTFCGLNGATMKFRSKSPDRAVSELLELDRRYSCGLHATDNILDLRYLQSVFTRLVELQADLRIFYETKANLTRTQLMLLARAGVKTLQPGIESLSTRILKLMRKGCTALQNIQLLKWSRAEGIHVAWNFLYGFPGEPRSEYDRVAEMLPSLAHLQAPTIVAPVRFDRFSPYHTEPEVHGIHTRRPHAAYAYVYPFARPSLDRMAYFFQYDHDASEPASYTARAVELLENWQECGNVKFEASDDSDGLEIWDTRFNTEKSHRISGIEREVILFCDAARSREAIRAHFGSRRWQEALERLSAERMVIEDDGWFLSLPVLPTAVHPREGAAAGCSALHVLP